MIIVCRFGGVKRFYIECLLVIFEEKRIFLNNFKYIVYILYLIIIRIDFFGFNKGLNGYYYSNVNIIYCCYKLYLEFIVLLVCKIIFFCKIRDKDIDIW